ncbi:cytochrome b5 [Strigomonas culicis]|uniref:Cytochrome b5 n=1 Tax=Strigomonas culicis TaxID=28005 RepID=S9V2B7_9TRYP|nr:cytochrome b5 [Strigomonas culicis]EPY37247.1 cytochrome b5 [Strigomonas culicis]|eukprot:EPY32850.1 cytochrome b5 [Strigomonas culicis]
MSQVFRAEEIAAHNTEESLWFVYKGRVYDVTKFADQHPGGVDTLMGVAGKEGTVDFDSVGHSDSAKEDLENYLIGTVHLEDSAKLGAPVYEQKTSYYGSAIILIMVAICLFFILKP